MVDCRCKGKRRRSEKLLPTERRFVRDGVRECMVMGRAGEPRPALEDRDIGVDIGGARGKRKDALPSSSTVERGEAVVVLDATGIRGLVYSEEVEAVG